MQFLSAEMPIIKIQIGKWVHRVEVGAGRQGKKQFAELMQFEI